MTNTRVETGKEERITKKRLAELRTEANRLKQEKELADTRWNEAQSAAFTAERELKRSEKPTPAMVALLQVLADGGVIRRNSWNYRYYVSNDGNNSNIRDSLFTGLCGREAIIRDGSNTRHYTWTISDNGRAILQRWAKKNPASAA